MMKYRPPTQERTILVRCLSCRHETALPDGTLVRFGLRSDAPIASFVKRLRCSKCGSASVMARRLVRGETRKHSQRRA